MNKRVGKSALAKARSWHWHQPNATQRNATQRFPPLRFWRPAGNRTRDCRSNSLPRYPLDHNDTVCPSVSGIGIYCLGWVLRLACLRCRARAAPGTRAARPVPARSAHVRAARARARPAPPHRQLTHVRSFVSFLWLLWFFRLWSPRHPRCPALQPGPCPRAAHACALRAHAHASPRPAPPADALAFFSPRR